MKEIKPFVECLRPIYIKNRRTGEPLITNCGHCTACRMHHQAMQSIKCKCETIVHPYCMFVTLTYDNNNVPLLSCSFEHSAEGLEICKFIPVSEPNFHKDDFNDVYITDTTHTDMIHLLNKFNLNGFIPVLSKYDIQKFLKRLRKNLTNHDSSFKIRYYAVGEYGPVHYRPHYHLLLWFKDQRILETLGEDIRKSWPYGRVDYSLTKGQSASYVAGYLNNYCNLPKVFQLSTFRPFASHSQELGEKVFKCSQEEIYDSDPLTVVRKSLPIDGTFRKVHMWRSLQMRYFPLCKDFASKSYDQRYYSYVLFRRCEKWLNETSPYKQAKLIADSILIYGTDREYYESLFGPLVADVIEYFVNSLLIEHDTNILPTDINALCFYVNGQKYNFIQFRQYLFQSIYYELRISYNFCVHCCNHKYTSTQILDFIISFYNAHALKQINEMYEYQNECDELELLTPNEIMYMYNNVESYFLAQYDTKDLRYYVRDKLLHSPLFKRYAQQIEDKFQKSIKHKVLNDQNKIFTNV